MMVSSVSTIALPLPVPNQNELSSWQTLGRNVGKYMFLKLTRGLKRGGRIAYCQKRKDNPSMLLPLWDELHGLVKSWTFNGVIFHHLVIKGLKRVG